MHTRSVVKERPQKAVLLPELTEKEAVVFPFKGCGSTSSGNGEVFSTLKAVFCLVIVVVVGGV